MSGVKVISKKVCSYYQPKDLVRVKQTLIVEENDKRFLVLRLVNERPETVTGFTLSVVCYDRNERVVAETNEHFSVNVGAGRKPFVPEQKIELDKSTVDCKVTVVAAEYGDFVYTPQKRGGMSIEYKTAPEKPTESRRARSAAASMTGNITVTKRSAKAPVIVIIALILSLLLASAAVFFYLNYFINNETTFVYGGVMYSFVGDDRSDGSALTAVGYMGARADIVIPEEINGHPVTRIANGAFAENGALRTIKFEKQIPIGDRAFLRCTGLREVEFEKVTSIGAAAFYGCSRLESVTIPAAVSTVSASAFFGCTNLRNIVIAEAETPIVLQSLAFGNCPGIVGAEFKRHIDYEGSFGFFKDSEIGSLDILDYDAGDKGLAAMFDDQDKKGFVGKIGSLIIGRVTAVPDDFAVGVDLGSVQISGASETVIGARAFSGCSSLKTFFYPLPVTRIGNEAFKNTAIQSFDLSRTSHIGESAFEGCKNLSFVQFTGNDMLGTLENGVFKDCTSLSRIAVPSKVTSVGNEAFSGCTSLAEISIARTSEIVSVGSHAFAHTAITKLEFPSDTLSSLGRGAFEGCAELTGFTVPASLHTIPTEAFKDCTSITDYDVPSHVTVIGQGAFSGCTSIKTISLPFIGESKSSDKSHLSYIFGAANKENSSVMPESLTTVYLLGDTLGSAAFYNCEHLTRIDLPYDVLTSISNEAFYGCTGLNALEIPSGVQSIGVRAFAGCTGITEFSVPSTVTTIGASAFRNCESVTSFVIPDSVTQIGDSAFAGCPLERLTVPFVGYADGVGGNSGTLAYVFNGVVPETLKTVEVTSAQALGDRAFGGCSNITEIILPETLTSIGSAAFIDCVGLSSVVVPKSVTSIGGNAFGGCAGLTEITLPFVGGVAATAGNYNVVSDQTQLARLFDRAVPHTLKKVTLAGNAPVYIAALAFNGCYYLEKLTLDCEIAGVGDEAFSSCYRLYEIFNFSNLVLATDTPNYGGIAQNALVVHTDENDEELPTFEENDFRYVRYNNTNYVIDHTPGEKSVVLPNTLGGDTSYAIWRFVFAFDEALESVVLPSSVTSIGAYAFSQCGQLEKFDASSSRINEIGRNSFDLCRELTEVSLPNTVTRIDEEAFYGCDRLTLFTLPRTVRYLGDNSFRNCIRLIEVFNYSNIDVYAGNSGIADHAMAVHSMGENAFDRVVYRDVLYVAFGSGDTVWYAVDYYGSGELVVSPFDHSGNRIERIGIYDYAFRNNYAVTSAKISNAVTELASNMFDGCYNITDVVLTNDVAASEVNIRSFAFDGLYSLKSFTAECPVRLLESYAFNNCSSLSKLVFDRVTEISDNAFVGALGTSTEFEFGSVDTLSGDMFGAINLTSLTVNKARRIADGAFSNRAALTSVNFGDVETVGTRAFAGCVNLKNVSFGELSSLGERAFFGCSALDSASFGNIGTMGEYAFSNCTSLKDITFGDVDRIGGNAFYGCSTLRSVTFGKVNTIGESAFSGLARLTDVTFDEVAEIGSNAFSWCKGITNITMKPVTGLTIGSYAFNGTSLSSFDFGEHTASVGSNAFSDTAIAEIKATRIDNIAENGFALMHDLTSVTI